MVERRGWRAVVGQCRETYLWCREDKARDCSGLLSSDPRLCGNFTFWAAVDCSKHGAGGEIIRDCQHVTFL